MAHTLGADLVVSNISAKYRLVSMLGEGGMGKVFLAVQTADTGNPKNIGRKVALKFLELELALSRVEDKEKEDRNQELMARFVSEGRLGFKLRHEHIVPTLDFGMDEADRPFLVSQFVEGVRPLSALIAQARFDHELAAPGSKPKHCLVPWSMLLRAGAQIASALAYMHQENVAHRDIKPENVLFTGEDRNIFTYIVDLGIAKNLGEVATDVKLTRDGHIVGTLTNMSPEQIFARMDPSGKKWDKGPHNDVYSFGTVLYELMTGQYYFRMDLNESVFACAHRVVQDEPIPLTEWIDNPNKDIELLIRRCLVKEPWLRPTMVEVRDELLALCQKPSTYPEQSIRVRAKESRQVNPDAQTVASIPPEPVIPKAGALPHDLDIEIRLSDAPDSAKVEKTETEQNQVGQKPNRIVFSIVLLVLAGLAAATYLNLPGAPPPAPPDASSSRMRGTTGMPVTASVPPAPSQSVVIAPVMPPPEPSKTQPVHHKASVPPTGEYKKIYDNGLSSYAAKDWRRAEIAMRLLLDNPEYANLPHAILVRAECLIQLKREEEATPLLKQYLQYPGSAKGSLSVKARTLVTP